MGGGPPPVPRGLRNFIEEIKMCKKPADETRRVSQELGKIRKKFAKSDQLSSYDLIKYIQKLAYVRVLGYQVDFGRDQVMMLMASPKTSEKSVGYIVATLLIGGREPASLRGVASILTEDLARRGLTSYESRGLALAYVTSSPILNDPSFQDFRGRVAAEAAALASDDLAPRHVRQKGALCLAAIQPHLKFVGEPPSWSRDVFVALSTDIAHVHSHGAAMCALRALSKTENSLHSSGNSNNTKWPDLATNLLLFLERHVQNDTVPQPSKGGDPSYFHGVYAPWLRLALVETLAEHTNNVSGDVLPSLENLVKKYIVKQTAKLDVNGQGASRGIRLAYLELGLRCKRFHPNVTVEAKEAIEHASIYSIDANEQAAAKRCLERHVGGSSDAHRIELLNFYSNPPSRLGSTSSATVDCVDLLTADPPNQQPPPPPLSNNDVFDIFSSPNDSIPLVPTTSYAAAPLIPSSDNSSAPLAPERIPANPSNNPFDLFDAPAQRAQPAPKTASTYSPAQSRFPPLSTPAAPVAPVSIPPAQPTHIAQSETPVGNHKPVRQPNNANVFDMFDNVQS